MEKLDSSQENLAYNEDWNFKEAIHGLKDFFGVDNLSNIELFHLKKITEDVAPRAKKIMLIQI